MAEKRKERTASESARSKRPAPTIDLTATEIPQSPDSPDPSMSEAAPQGAAAESSSEAAAPETESAPSAADATASGLAPEPPQAESDAPEEPPPTEPPPLRPRPGFAAPLAAGFLGAVLVAAILAGLWSSGMLSGTAAPDLTPRLTGLEQQVAALQSGTQALQGQVQALQKRTASMSQAPAASVDPKTVDALAERVAKLESGLKNQPANADAQVVERLAAMENTVKSNSSALAALRNQLAALNSDTQAAAQQRRAADQTIAQLRSRVDELARRAPSGVTPAQLSALEQKIAGLEQSSQTAQSKIAQNATAASNVRIALAASALRNAVLSRAPYEAELAQAKSLGADAKALAPLERFAASGVPSDAQLAAELDKLLPALTQASGVENETTGTFIERLRANAGRLVHVTPVNAPKGDAPSDVLARLKIEAAHSDIDAALNDIAKLPPAAQAKASDWVATAKARREALNAARQLASETAQSLGTR